MPTYTVELDGKQYDIQGDREPTEQDVRQALSEYSGPKSNASIKTEGMSYASNHPFKTAFDPLAKTLTGQSVQDRALSATQVQEPSVKRNAQGTFIMPKPGDVFGGKVKNAAAGMAGSAADIATTPASYAPIPGMAVANKIPGLNKAFNYAIENAPKDLMNIGKNVVNSGKSVGGNISNIIHPERLAKEVRGEMFNLRSKLGKELDSNIQTLSKTSNETIDLSPHFHDLKNVMASEEGVGIRADILRTIREIKDPETSKLLIKAVKNPDSASNLTLQQSELIKRAISNSSTIGTKSKQGKFANWTSGDMELLDLVDNIKLSQAEKFDSLSELRKPYADYMQAYNVVKNKFKPGQLIKNMKSGFGDQEVKQLAEKVMPQDVVKKITGYRRTGKALKYGATAIGAEEVLRNMFKHR